tara:strand:- start:760 stop:1455 length:696 start_codon:yes stop_codon:yes gene_type:complete
MQTSKGVMYYVNDEYYIPMAIHSIKSLNNVSQLPISVYTSFVKDFSNKDNNLKNVDIIKIPEEPIKISQDAKTKFNSAAWRGKLKAYFEVPYDTTLFLDADTEILRDPTEIMTQDFDIAFCRETNFEEGRKTMFHPSFNTGVVVINKNDKTLALFKEALRLYDECVSNLDASRAYGCNDQKQLNQAYLNNPNIVLKFLSNDWNVREATFNLIKNHKIVHIQNIAPRGFSAR